jgi:threonine efflux protein
VTDAVNLPVILGAAFLAAASPGPSNLAIAETAMRGGRLSGLAFAAGVTTGGLAWSCAAALGLGAVMAANAWVFEAVRYGGGAYLLWLALRSARDAARPDAPDEGGPAGGGVRRSAGRTYLRGLGLHLTNPKAILFFGSLYALGVGPGTSAAGLATVVAAVGLQSALIFHGYALLFSNERIARGYARLRRWLSAAFALAFGAAGLRMLVARP